MGGRSQGGRDADSPAAFTLLELKTLQYEMRRRALMVTGPGTPPPPSVVGLEMIHLSRWGWNHSAAGRGFSLNECRLSLWSFNEFIR